MKDKLRELIGKFLLPFYKGHFWLGLIILSFFFTNKSYSQTLCSQNLSAAQNSFDNGHLYSIPSDLKDCLDNGFTKQEKIQAYKLLTITYLFIDDPISAENSYLSLLHLDPEHQLDPSIDPIELIYLSRKFKTTPIFELTLGKAGMNFSSTSVIHNNGVDNTSLTVEKYTPMIGFQLGAAANLNITPQLSLNGEFLFSNRRFSYYNVLFVDDPQNYIESQVWVEAPFYLKYAFKKNRFYPFIYAGYSLETLLGANWSIGLDDITRKSDNSVDEITPVTGPDVNIKSIRKTFSSSLVFGLGFRYRIGYQYLSFDFRAKGGMKNLVDASKQLDTTDPVIEELRFRYGSVEDDFRLNSLSFSIGYVKPLYKPRKIVKQSVKGFIKNLFNKKGGNEEIDN